MSVNVHVGRIASKSPRVAENVSILDYPGNGTADPDRATTDIAWNEIGAAEEKSGQFTLWFEGGAIP